LLVGKDLEEIDILLTAGSGYLANRIAEDNFKTYPTWFKYVKMETCCLNQIFVISYQIVMECFTNASVYVYLYKKGLYLYMENIICDMK